eukprot:34835-Pyramimonas_sp.AAC.1
MAVHGLRLLPLVFTIIVMLSFHRHLMDWYYHIHLPTLSSLDSMLPHHNHHPRLSTVLSDPKSWPSSTIVPVVRQLKMLSLPTTKLCPGAAQPWDPIPSYSSSPDLSATTEEGEVPPEL